MTVVTGTIQQRHDTAANWTANNPTLLLAEVGYETDTKKRKTGDGVTAWNALAYDSLGSSGITSVVGTANRISVDNTDPDNPVLNIDAAYDAAIVTAINSAVSDKQDKPSYDIVTTATTYTLDITLYNRVRITALASAIIIANPTGTPYDGQQIIYEIRDNGTARAFTAFGSAFNFSTDLQAPTTTIINKWLLLGFQWNATISKWQNLAQLNNFT